MRLRFYFIVCCLLWISNAHAQNGSVSITPIYDDDYVEQNFCGAVVTLLGDAGNKFGKAKGKEIDTHGDVAIWSSNTGMPGAITSSLLFTTTWHYEGVIYQGTSEMEMVAAYKRYRKLLDACLDGKGYFVSTEKNAEAKLESSPTVVFTKSAEGEAHKPHVSLEAAYTEQTNTYTLAINVWE